MCHKIRIVVTFHLSQDVGIFDSVNVSKPSSGRHVELNPFLAIGKFCYHSGGLVGRVVLQKRHGSQSCKNT